MHILRLQMTVGQRSTPLRQLSKNGRNGLRAVAACSSSKRQNSTRLLNGKPRSKIEWHLRQALTQIGSILPTPRERQHIYVKSEVSPPISRVKLSHPIFLVANSIFEN